MPAVSLFGRKLEDRVCYCQSRDGQDRVEEDGPVAGADRVEVCKPADVAALPPAVAADNKVEEAPAACGIFQNSRQFLPILPPAVFLLVSDG